MIILQNLDPDEARKAASFVKALAELEERFDLRLDLPGDGVRIGPLAAPYAVTRKTTSDPLTLAVEVSDHAGAMLRRGAEPGAGLR